MAGQREGVTGLQAEVRMLVLLVGRRGLHANIGRKTGECHMDGRLRWVEDRRV